jgi:hypothetical protein
MEPNNCRLSFSEPRTKQVFLVINIPELSEDIFGVFVKSGFKIENILNAYLILVTFRIVVVFGVLSP